MKLREWAKTQGIHYNTAYRWFNLGLIPNAIKLLTGTILIQEKNNNDLIGMISSFCCKKYGIEEGLSKTKDIMQIMNYEVNNGIKKTK